MSEPSPQPVPTPPPGKPPASATAPSVRATAPADRLPTDTAEYHHFLRTPTARWWKGLLLVLSFVVVYLVLSLALSLVAIMVDVSGGRLDAQALSEGRVTLALTPALLLATNLAPAVMIVVSMLLQWAFFGQRPRWLHSVQGAFRWRLLGRAAVFIVPLWAVYVLVATFAFPRPPSEGFTSQSVLLLVVVLLTTSLQAAGEEYGARGLISRAVGSWVADSWLALLLGTLVSAVLFTLAHGAGDPWLIGYYFVFAVSLSVVTWRTGGLEVAILIHAVNNLFLFTLLISLGSDLSQAFNRQNGVGGPSMLLAMAMMVLIASVVWWWARRSGIVRAAKPAQPPVVPPLPPMTREAAPRSQAPLDWPE